MKKFVFVVLLVLASVFADSIISFGATPTSVSPGGSVTVSASLTDASGKPAAVFYRFGVATNKYWLKSPSKALSDGTGGFSASFQIPADFIETYSTFGGVDEQKMVYPVKFEVLVDGDRKHAFVNVINKGMTDRIADDIYKKVDSVEQKSLGVYALLARLIDSHGKTLPALVPNWQALRTKTGDFREGTTKLKQLCSEVKGGPTLENLKALREEYLLFGISMDSLKKEMRKVIAETEGAVV